MSLLLPEKLSGGLFPGQCWLRRGRATTEHPIVLDGDQGASAVVTALGALLDAQSPALRMGAKVSLMLSDGLAALAALPWHEQLTAPAEIKGYAVACFERQGLDMKSGWVMHAEFRTPGSMGLAYAIPEPLLVSLVAVLEKRGLKLDRLLPVTAWAYWRLPRYLGVGQQLLVLRESSRIGAMVFDQKGLQGLDVEPVTGSTHAALRRLLARIGAYHSHVGNVVDWSATEGADAELSAVLAECLPNAAIRAATRHEWS